LPSRPKQTAPAEPGLTHRALLPAGLNDGLPPDAAHEAAIVERLIASFAGHGYDRVKPPLVEFEETLLGGSAAGMSNRTFRVMDPVSRRMMGVRADMTLQVARIATTRLVNAPRPLRLSYAGDVLRVMGAQLSPERQFMQVGAELIGSAAAGADVEIVSLAAAALRGLGIDSLSVDLIAPPLADALIVELGFDRVAARRLREALDRKDAAAVAELTSGRGGTVFAALMAATGSAARGRAALGAMELPGKAASIRDRLVHVIDLLTKAAPDLPLTVDPVENRGFEYHTGVSFSIFARGVRGELGRGGRYVAGEANEPATGFTLYMDTMLRALPAPAPGRRLFVPADAPAGEAGRLRAQGWPVVAALESVADPATEARRLGCSHVWRGGVIEAVREKTA
jgi:ATP phosphoribosyltransferase regulatory subunit